MSFVSHLLSNVLPTLASANYVWVLAWLTMKNLKVKYCYSKCSQQTRSPQKKKLFIFMGFVTRFRAVFVLCFLSAWWAGGAHRLHHIRTVVHQSLCNPTRWQATCCWLTVDPALIHRRFMYTPRISCIDQIVTAAFEKQAVTGKQQTVTPKRNRFFFFLINMPLCKCSLEIFPLLVYFLLRKGSTPSQICSPWWASFMLKKKKKKDQSWNIAGWWNTKTLWQDTFSASLIMQWVISANPTGWMSSQPS